MDKYCKVPGVNVSEEIKTESPATLTRLDESAEFKANPTAADWVKFVAMALPKNPLEVR